MTKRIVTHSGKFHSDDVFAVAALRRVFDDVEILRTRDESIVQSADIVVDVGGIYNPATGRFDHHQESGAGVRDNGIPYASFGIVWKAYGEQICGDIKIAHIIDRTLVQPVDAGDNGVDLYTTVFPGIFPYTVGSIVNLFRPTHTEEEDYDALFLRAVEWAAWVLEREIKISKDAQSGKSLVETFYNNSTDKRLIIFDTTNVLGRELTVDFLMKYPEVLYAVIYRKDVDSWQLIAVNESEETYRVRKPLPKTWAGKRDHELVGITGVPDAIFCHRGLFMAVAKSKEGALKLAQIALTS